MKMPVLDRLLLFLTSLLAAYQVAVGIDGLNHFSTFAYTVAFGVLLVAGLLLLILGFEALEAPIVVIVSTIIPLSLSLGLVWQHLPAVRFIYLVFCLLGFLAILLTRSIPIHNQLPTLILVFVHGVAGLIITLLPVVLSVRGVVNPIYSLVGLGGASISLGGLSLLFLRIGKPFLSKARVLKILPGLLLFMVACFVVGFKFG